jgi:three-Cys-motif partner protein
MTAVAIDVPRERRFFATVSSREWTWIKHSVLGHYMPPWSRKVGSRAGCIWVVDCFAGAGGYVDKRTGERRDGSPVLAAREALGYRAQRPGKQMRVICVEQNHDNFVDLEKRVAGFGDTVTCLEGDFAEHVPTILRMIGNDPALVLLDPIGLKAINADGCRGLLDRRGKTDLFVIVDFSIVHRTRGMLDESGEPLAGRRSAPKLAANVDAFYAGSKAWRQVPPSLSPEERERAYLRLYFEEVLLSSFEYVGCLPVRKAVGASPEYWMVHAASHLDAHLLMNDEIARVDSELYRRTYANGLPELVEQLHEQRQAERLAALRRDIIVFIRRSGPDGTTVGKVVEQMLGRHFGLAKINKWSGDYGRIFRELISEGDIRRDQERLRARFEPGERLTAIPTDGAANADDKEEKVA